MGAAGSRGLQGAGRGQRTKSGEREDGDRFNELHTEATHGPTHESEAASGALEILNQVANPTSVEIIAFQNGAPDELIEYGGAAGLAVPASAAHSADHEPAHHPP